MIAQYPSYNNLPGSRAPAATSRDHHRRTRHCRAGACNAGCGGFGADVQPTPEPAEIKLPTPTSVPLPTQGPAAAPEPHPVTIDGWDPNSGTIIDPVRMWKNYTNRALGVAAEVRHGEIVNLIERRGDGVLVETRNRKQGWLMYLFVAELK